MSEDEDASEKVSNIKGHEASMHENENEDDELR